MKEVLFLPHTYNLTNIYRMDTCREVAVCFLWNIIAEVLLPKRCSIHDLTLYHRIGFLEVRSAILGISYMYGLKNGVTSVEMECLVSTIIVYMTTTNNEGLIPSLFFYPVISCEGSKIYFFLNAVEKKLSFLKPTFIHIFDYLDFRFKLEKQRNYQCCPITIFCANKLLVPVRDKDLLRKVPIAYSFQCALAVPLAYSRRNSMQLMPHRDS